jgi:hypothetical protein
MGSTGAERPIPPDSLLILSLNSDTGSLSFSLANDEVFLTINTPNTMFSSMSHMFQLDNVATFI